MTLSRFACSSAAVLGGLFASSLAQAHFVLQAPANFMSQDANGLPIKMPPCGNEAGGTPTNMVTPYQEGQTISITINEVVPHPGHYRVALAMNQASLPADPVVTAGATPCGTAAIMNPAVLPVLKDDALDHTAAFVAPQTFTVTLPAGFTCTNCVLQVIEFMGNHGVNPVGGCFYHHCANISVTAATPINDGSVVVVSDAGEPIMSTDDLGTTPNMSTDASAAPIESTDMAHKPPAPSVGLPGCSVAPQDVSGLGIAIGFALLLLGATLLPRIARRRI